MDIQNNYKAKGFVNLKQIILLFILILSNFILILPSTAESEKTLIYYGSLTCPACHEKIVIVEDFIADYPDVQLEKYMLNFSNPENGDFIEEEFEKYEIDRVLVPTIVLLEGEEYTVMPYIEITYDNLVLWYNGKDFSSDSGRISGFPILMVIFGIGFGLSELRKKTHSFRCEMNFAQ